MNQNRTSNMECAGIAKSPSCCLIPFFFLFLSPLIKESPSLCQLLPMIYWRLFQLKRHRSNRGMKLLLPEAAPAQQEKRIRPSAYYGLSPWYLLEYYYYYYFIWIVSWNVWLIIKKIFFLVLFKIIKKKSKYTYINLD